MSQGGDSKHNLGCEPTMPPEVKEWCRLVARILRRRTGNQELAEDQSPELIPGVAPTERLDIEDKSEEGQG